MHPVGLNTKVFVVHSLASDGHIRRLRFGVLFEHAFPTFEVHLKDFIAGAEGMQLRPMIEVLKGIVGSIVSAPTHETLQIAAVIEVPPKKFAAGWNVVGQELSLEHSPLRRRHRRLDFDDHIGRHGPR